MERFGTYISNLRISKGLTLREFCRRSGFDPSNWSKIERSLLPPPRSKKVIEMVLGTIGVENGSDDYNTLLDLALLESIPEDFVSEREILRELPVFFRTARGETPSEEDLQKLIDFLKNQR